MSFTVQGPKDDAINAVLAAIQQQAKSQTEAVLRLIGEGVVSVLQKGYESQVYGGQAGGAFGDTRRSGKVLAQSIQSEQADGTLTIFTNKKEAPYVEFGTGIYAKAGRKGAITPKRAKRLAFPVWQLPVGFKGLFISRENSNKPLPFGAIGVVLARSVKGMKPRPVWENPAVEKAILRIVDDAMKDFQ